MVSVSVVLPVYNGEEFLDRSISSVLGQTYSDIELVIVDDGSDDHTAEIIDQYASKDNRVHPIHKARGGLIRARIDGISNSIGKYIAFIDADDWWDDDFLAVYMDEMLKADVDLVTGGCVIEQENGSATNKFDSIPSGCYDPADKNAINSQMLYHSGFFKFGVLPYLWNKLFKKDLLLTAYQGIDERITDGEDVAVLEPYLLMADSVSIMSVAKYHYVKHGNQMTDIKGKDFYENVSRLYLNLKERTRKYDGYEAFLPQLDQYMRYMISMKKGEMREGKPGEQSTLDGFLRKLVDYKEVVIVGAGHFGHQLLTEMRSRSCNNIVCIADNNADRLLEELDNIKVMTVDKAVKIFPEAFYIVSPRNHRVELIRQLVHLGISIDRIDVYESEKLGV